MKESLTLLKGSSMVAKMWNLFMNNQTIDEFIEAHKRIRNKETRAQLKDDLIEHLWRHFPDKY